jgi:hypothetical protein
MKAIEQEFERGVLEVMGECENIWKQDLSKIHFKKGE